MNLLHAGAVAAIMGAAIYMILSRNLVRIMLGLALLSTGVNLLLFTAGGFSSRQPPIIAPGARQLGAAADPLAQALILTAIVIGFALTVVLAAIVLRAWRATGSLDARTVEAAEQPNDPDLLDPDNE